MENKIKIGDIFHHSWGYNMTHNVFIQVVEISKTGKTATCRKLINKVTEGDGWTGEETTIKGDFNEQEPFKMRIQGEDLRGSFPYCGSGESKTLGSFWRWEGTPKYYNYMD